MVCYQYYDSKAKKKVDVYATIYFSRCLFTLCIFFFKSTETLIELAKDVKTKSDRYSANDFRQLQEENQAAKSPIETFIEVR